MQSDPRSRRILRNQLPGIGILVACSLLSTFPSFAADDTASRLLSLGPSTRIASAFPGADIGEKIAAAYADLPEGGGSIILTEGGSFAQPLVFGSNGKVVLLVGLPGDVVTLRFTGEIGAAITFDCGTGHRMGYGIRDLTLTGPGNSTGTTGVMFGGDNGAEGIAFRDFKIQSFGINLRMGSHTWLAYFDHGMIRDGGFNVFLPSGLIEAGEQIVFNHVTFADAPAPHRNSVWIQGGGHEVVFTDCSFDQAQLRIGNGAISAAQIVVKGSHFENPGFVSPGAVPYDYVVVDNHPGNLVRVSDSYFLQDAPSRGPARFIMANGGKLVLCGVGMFTPASAPMKNFATLANNALVETYGFNDLSGNVTGGLFGK